MQEEVKVIRGGALEVSTQGVHCRAQPVGKRQLPLDKGTIS